VGEDGLDIVSLLSILGWQPDHYCQYAASTSSCLHNVTSIPSMLVAVGLALAIMYLPGLAILNRPSAFRSIDGVSRLCIAPGVSAAMYMVLFALSYVFGITLGPWTPWAFSILALGSLC
jgi:hypothetical protein